MATARITVFPLRTGSIAVVASLLFAILCFSTCSDPYKGFIIDPDNWEDQGGEDTPNQAPSADFSINPESGTVFTDFFFNAHSCNDPDDYLSELEVRWDWNDDGVYDTGWSRNLTIYMRFPVRTDSITVGMQVRDPHGLADACRRGLFVESAPVVEAAQFTGMEFQGNWVPALADDGSVYFGGHFLYSFQSDGTLNWGSVISTGFSSPVIGHDGTIYGATSRSGLFAFEPVTGNVIWSFTAGGPIRSSPAIGANGSIYFGASDGFLYSLTNSGQLNWKHDIGIYTQSSPAIGSDGTIYCGSIDCHLYAISPDDSLLWGFEAFGTNGGFNSSPALGDDGVIYIGSEDQNLYAVNPDGIMRWFCHLTGMVISSPAIGTDGNIYTGTILNYIYAIDPSGLVLWEYRTEGEIRSSPAVGADGMVYIGSMDGYLYAFNSSGELVKMYWRAGGNTSPTIAQDGTVYVGSYTVSTESMGLADSPWPKFRGNRYNTGRR